ncbi:MAG: hypothetical protein ABEK50_05875 [bacterium]
MRPKVLLLAVVGFLLIPFIGLAQESVPTDELRSEFFDELNKPQIIKYMSESDKAKQLTSYELGAKYRWGYIPPDRTPPASVAQWWRSLSTRERNDQRYKWFREHYDRVNPDRVARQLGLQDQLTKIYRELRKDYTNDEELLEPVPFPDTNVSPVSANQGATEFQNIYEQNPGNSSEKEIDRRPEYLPEESQPESNQRPDQESSSPESQRTEESVEPSQEEPSPDTQPSNPDQQNEKAGKSPEVEVFASGDLKYRRVGDHIEVIGRTDNESADTGSTNESPNTTTMSDTDASENMKPEESSGRTTGSDTVGIPPPVLRNQSSSGETSDQPEMRRSQ